jgi:hypothetical protein
MEDRMRRVRLRHGTRAEFAALANPFAEGNTFLVVDPPTILQARGDGVPPDETALIEDDTLDVSDMDEHEIERIDEMRVVRIDGRAWKGWLDRPVMTFPADGDEA